jgi:acetolactate synthase I/III small subunit
VLKGDDASLDLCTKQLRKLVNVVEVMDFKDGQTIARELVLVKVRPTRRRARRSSRSRRSSARRSPT